MNQLINRTLAVLDNTKIHLLIIILFTVGVYANTLGNQFVWDDKTFARWELTKSFAYLPELLKGALPPPHEGDFRPIKSLVLALDYKLFGNNPFWYHIQAILIHVWVTVLFYFLTRKIFEGGVYASNSSLVAFLAALTFGIHPIQTEAVTFVTASTDIVGVILFILAFYFYIKAGKFLLLSAIFALMAYFAYEATLVFLALLVVYDWCFDKDKSFAARGGGYLLYCGTVIFWAVLRFLILQVSQANSWPEGNFFLTAITMVKAFLKYITLTVFPSNLSINHYISNNIPALFYVDFNQQAFISQKISDSSFLLALAALVLTILFAVFVRKRWPVVTFCVFWFLIALVPFSNILPLNNFMSERYLYLASFGWCLLVAYAATKVISYKFPLTLKLWRAGKVRSLERAAGVVGIVGFSLLLVFYSARTVLRNRDWRDSEALWSKTLSQTPTSVLANHNLANVYLEQGEFEKAAKLYNTAEANNIKNIVEVKVNYAQALYKLGEYNLALEKYLATLGANDKNEEVFFGIGQVYEKKGDKKKAKQAYLKAISLRNAYFDPHINLGTIYAEEKNYELAIGEFDKAAIIWPNNYLSYLNLGLVYQKLGKTDLAMEKFKKVLELQPQNQTAIEQIQKITIFQNIQKKLKEEE